MTTANNPVGVHGIIDIDNLLQRSPRVVPVVTLTTAQQVTPLITACRNTGIQVLEITLRSAAGLDAIKALREQAPDILIGAGTVNTPAQFDQAVAVGAQFIVSPGASAELIQCAKHHTVVWLPGVMTPSEIMTLRSAGFTHLKLFPAQLAGGIAFLNAMAAVFPDIRFFPTGGITPDNYTDFLRLSNVICVGGTWLTPVPLLKANDWNGIEELLSRLVNTTI